MSEGFAVALMMNNYLHDVATALLAASGVALAAMLAAWERFGGDASSARCYLAIHRRMTTLAKFSFAWIVLGGIPRAIWYTEFEWANAAGRSQVPALVLKHVVAFAFVASGVVLWRRLEARASDVRALAAAADRAVAAPREEGP